MKSMKRQAPSVRSSGDWDIQADRHSTDGMNGKKRDWRINMGVKKELQSVQSTIAIHQSIRGIPQRN